MNVPQDRLQVLSDPIDLSWAVQLQRSVLYQPRVQPLESRLAPDFYRWRRLLVRDGEFIASETEKGFTMIFSTI